MTYDFKKAEEFGWAVAVAVSIFILDILVNFDPAAVNDWRTWLVALAGGAIRAAAGAGIVVVSGWAKRKATQDPPTEAT